MQLPTIHANGTSKDLLMLALTEASDSLEAAYDKLKKTAPNGRDYYTQGANALDQATREHMSRLRRLDAVKNEIDAMTVEIDRM